MKKKKDKDFNNKMLKNLGGNFLLWILIIIISVTLLQYLTVSKKNEDITYSEFNDLCLNQAQSIKTLVIEGNKVIGECLDSSPCVNINGMEFS